jgi:hypothetical protein
LYPENILLKYEQAIVILDKKYWPRVIIISLNIFSKFKIKKLSLAVKDVTVKARKVKMKGLEMKGHLFLNGLNQLKMRLN